MPGPVDRYIARFPPNVRSALQKVRTAIRKAVPQAEEGISYQIAAYQLDGEVVIYFAGWKAHYSVYPATDGLLEAFADELADYEVSKGTIRFPLDDKVPVGLIGRLAKFRARAARERAEAKAAKRPRKVAKKSAPKKGAAKKRAAKKL
jgi:uncharacterized protein YdhG (YjbR/CyaY superfamily)